MKKIFILSCLFLILSIIAVNDSLLFAQTNVVIANVSVSPMPFSPDNDGQNDETTISFNLYYTEDISNPQVEIIVFRDNDLNDIIKNIYEENPMQGLNYCFWDGKDNTGTTVLDGNYGIRIIFKDNGTELENYSLHNGIIVSTLYPEIELISSSPNPFSPNDDGFQDVHSVNFKVKNTQITYIGLIKFDFSDSTIVFEDGPYSLPTDGTYLFVNRPASKSADITIPANMVYNLTLEGFETEIIRGRSIYKLGENYQRVFSVNSGNVGFSFSPELLEAFDEGIDYLAIYGVSSNLSFNILNNNGSQFSLNDLYSQYYGSFMENTIDHTDVSLSTERQYLLNIGKNENQFPGQEMSDGRYLYRLVVSNAVETSAVTSGEFIVNNNPIQVSGQTIPEQISPQTIDGYFDSTVIQYSPSEDAYINVKIFDTEDILIRTLVQAQLNLAQNGNYVIWDGKDNAGNIVSMDSSATYYVEVTAVDKYINDDIVNVIKPVLVDNSIPLPAVLNQTQPDSLNLTDITLSGISNEINCDIILIHNEVNKGVVGVTPQYPGYFEFPVSLEEGENNIQVKLRDSVYNLGSQSNDIFYYVDSQKPEIVNIYPDNNFNFSSLPMIFKANIIDDGIGVSRVRFGFSFNDNPNLSWITATEDSVNYYSCIINSTHSQFTNDPDQVLINMYVSAIDSLNNIIISEIPMTYNYFKPTSVTPPEFVSSYPINESNIKSINNNQISIVINSEIPLIEEETDLILTNGVDSLYHNNGAILSQNNEGNEYEIILSLINSLSVDGSDDALYSIYYSLKTEINQEKEGVISFNYDTQKPLSTATKINNSELFIANNQTYFNADIDSISVYIDDLLSGVNYASNMTRVSLLNSSNQVVTGIRSHSKVEKRITWKLHQSLSISNHNNLGLYTIQLLTTDNAGNVLSQEMSFRLINATQPQITEHIPQANININQLVDNRITKKVLDTNGFGLDKTNTTIILNSPDNSIIQGDISFDNLSNNLYNVNFNLLNPLSLNGIYTIESIVIDTLGQQVADTMNFTFDNQAPLVSNALIGGLDDAGQTWQASLVNNQNYTSDIYYVQIDYSDITSSVNWNSQDTFIKLYTSNNQLVSGSKNETANTLSWMLNNPILTDGSMDGLYYVTYSAIDFSGNIVSGRYDFRVVNPNSPQITQIIPNSNSIINSLENNKVIVNFTDDRGIDLQNYENNYIKLVLPNNNVIEHSAGANLIISLISTDNYKMELTLNQPLVLNGNYLIQIHLENDQEYSSSIVSEFMYDSQMPEINNLILGLTNDTEVVVTDDDLVYTGVNYIKAQISDIVSGIDYDVNNTNFQVYANGSLVSGTLSSYPNEGFVKYTFANTLNEVNVNVQVNLIITDNAGNELQSQTEFVLTALNANIISVSPVNNSYVNSNLNQVKLVVEYPETVTINQSLSYLKLLHPDGTFIENGQGAVLQYVNNNNMYELILNLNQALSVNGQDDGQYQISAYLVTDLGQDGPMHFSFTYDSLSPYFDNLKVNETFIANSQRDESNKVSRQTQVKSSDVLITEDINYIQTNYYDITTSVNFASNLTTLTLMSPNGNLIQGSRVISDNNISWVLNNPVLANGSNDGVYTIQLKATDLAGNIFTHTESFTLMSQIIPVLIDFTPENVFGFNINQFGQIITADFKNTVPIIQDYEETYIKLVFPNGYIIEAGQGANLSYEIQQNNLHLDFVMTDELSLDGENDGTFQVLFRAKNISGAIYEETKSFIYDTINPSYNSLMVLSDETQIQVAQNALITESIDVLQVKFTDSVSGVHYAPNITYISLFNPLGELIPGTLSYSEVEGIIVTKWTLNQALPVDGTADGQYQVKLKITDRSGNSILKTVDFNLVSVLNPYSVVTMIDAIYNVHLIWSNESGNLKSNIKESKYRDLNTYQIYRRYNNEDYLFIGETLDNYFIDNMIEHPDGMYQYSVRAVYEINNQILLSDFAYGEGVEIYRFIPCKFILSLQNDATPEDIMFNLNSQDGLYNQEYNILTDNSGIIELPEVFMNTYILTLSKEGYNTITDTITIDDNSSEFNYTLSSELLLLNEVPTKYELYQNYPNPFNPITQIKFALKEDSNVEISIYNVKGQRVNKLVEKHLKAGYHKTVWNGKDEYGNKSASGIYLYVLNVQGEKSKYREIKKMMLIK
ncbi:MAG: hypothetical protein M0Q94_05840 [Candidatus Cloacimonetes bacterium]|nr:hypothetical protein [Candidatus Cloacimonadota bacterium]